MYILLVEDDHLQAEWIESTLAQEFPGIVTKRVSTESEFYDRLDEIEKNPPDMIIMDVMLRWADPGDARPVPDNVQLEKFYRAGIRCVKLLLERERTRNIPVVGLYTVLERADLSEQIPARIHYLRKEEEPQKLFSLIRRYGAESKE